MIMSPLSCNEKMSPPGEILDQGHEKEVSHDGRGDIHYERSDSVQSYSFFVGGKDSQQGCGFGSEIVGEAD